MWLPSLHLTEAIISQAQALKLQVRFMSIETLIKSRGFPEFPQTAKVKKSRDYCGLRFTFVRPDSALEVSEVSQGLIFHRNVILQDEF